MTVREMADYSAKNGPSGGPLIKWKCGVCHHWHYWAKAPAPAGASSGNTRPQRIPEHIKTLIRETQINEH